MLEVKPQLHVEEKNKMSFNALFDNLWSPPEDERKIVWGEIAYCLMERIEDHEIFTHVVYFIPSDNWSVHKTYTGFKNKKSHKRYIKKKYTYKDPMYWLKYI